MERIANVLEKKLKKPISFKSLGNNASALTKFFYLTKVLANIDNYALTDKADGERVFILASLDGATLLSSTSQKKLPIKTLRGIFDAELVGEKAYIFDVIEYENQNTSKLPFSDRLKILEKIKPEQNICIKKYVKLDKNYKSTIETFYNQKRPYEIDGLIFTSLDKSYVKTENLKWKPPSHLTIDFLYANETLFCGIDKKSWKQYGFPLPDNYFDILPSNVRITKPYINVDYFPVPFVTSFGNFSKLTGRVPKNIESKIVELSLNDDRSWHFHRVREDRLVEVQNGNYFGNNYRVAEKTLESALNPLTLKDLITLTSSATYFQKSDDRYFAVRKFNNYVKKLLIERHKQEFVFDLASGKGQDLMKYSEAGVKRLLMMELDFSAIDELLERKYEILSHLFIPNLSAPISLQTQPNFQLLILQTDLNLPYLQNRQKIDTLVPNGKPGVIFCNFALHYLMDNEKQMENIVELISSYLEKNGEFIFTALDREKVNTLLTKGKWEVMDNDKVLYSLEYADAVEREFRKINVLLPCSETAYPEPLINLKMLDRKFAKYGIIREDYQTFDVLLNDFKSYRQQFYSKLSKTDIEFISLYSYCVYKKH